MCVLLPLLILVTLCWVLDDPLVNTRQLEKDRAHRTEDYSGSTAPRSPTSCLKSAQMVSSDSAKIDQIQASQTQFCHSAIIKAGPFLSYV